MRKSDGVAEPNETTIVDNSLSFQITFCLECAMRGFPLFRRGLASALAAAFLLAGAAVALSACNTTAGAGEDISGAGHAVTSGAEKTKQAL
jgi:entericidin B